MLCWRSCCAVAFVPGGRVAAALIEAQTFAYVYAATGRRDTTVATRCWSSKTRRMAQRSWERLYWLLAADGNCWFCLPTSSRCLACNTDQLRDAARAR